MNDVERELRELFEEKARDARTVPAAPPVVLKRGRRRQIGTVAIGATTAILVAVTSVAILRSVGPGAPTTPGSDGLGERTATIQNFTVTAPTGWTLIDWGPSTATGLSLAAASPQTPPPASPVYVHPSPVLELANIDPGLDKRAACSADAVVGSTEAALLIVLGNDGTSAAPGSWPVPIDPNSPPVVGPCGEGFYASFSLGGLPYFAFLGIGNAGSDAERQALFDAYTGMQAQIAPLATTTSAPLSAVGYVLAAGTEQGVPWRLELGPPITLPTMTAVNRPRTACLRVISANDFGFGCTPFSEASAAAGLGPSGQLIVDRIFIDGPVLPDATAVEFQTPGQDPVEATILSVPDSFRSSVASLSGGDVPSRLYWMLVDQHSATAVPLSRVVQLAADGSQLSSQPIVITILGSSSGALAQRDLRNALVAAKTHYTDRASYAGFTAGVAESIEPSLTYNTSSTAIDGEISIRDVTSTTVLFVTAEHDGSVWCIADDASTSTTTYGVIDAQTAAQCVGGEAAWGIGPTKDTIGTGQALGDTWTLKASLHPAYCTELDFGSESWDGCISQPVERVGPDPDRPSSEYFQVVPGGALDVESVPTVVVSIEVRAASGAVFTGLCLAAPAAYGPVRYCVVGLEGEGQGTVHFLAADGSEAFPSYAIDWTRQTAAGYPSP